MVDKKKIVEAVERINATYKKLDGAKQKYFEGVTSEFKDEQSLYFINQLLNIIRSGLLSEEEAEEAAQWRDWHSLEKDSELRGVMEEFYEYKDAILEMGGHTDE